MINALRSPDDRRWYRLALASIVVAAWGVLAIWGASPAARLLDHHALGETGVPPFVGPIVFLIGWTLMVVAMMLPASMPLVNLVGRLLDGNRRRGRMLAALCAGYLVAWVTFGLLVILGDSVLHAVARLVEPDPRWVAGAVLVGAGVYQFTPLKSMCLDKCRSPLVFVVEHWGSRRTIVDTFRLGVAHGKFCVGCCWTLMLVMVAVGSMNFGWMLALGAVMATERSTSWGARLTRPLGIALIVAGFATFIRGTL
jgi:predicted metal-binding membrane protein